MSKRFTLKSVFSLIVILLTALVLVACGGENDQELVDAALDSVVVPFAGSDSATSVTQNLTLPTLSGDITISWVSNSPAVISNAGVVTRPAVGQPNATVVLTATLTLGEATATKDFTVVVPAMVLTDQQVVDAAVTSLAVTYATSDSMSSVTGNVTLPTTVGTVAVAWTSSNAAVISNAGVVTRPAAGQPNVTVTLTAALSKGAATGTKTFTLTVIALPVLITDQDLVDEALLTLAITLAPGDTLAAVTQNVTTGSMAGTINITWSSNNAAVISNAGVVTRPAKGTADVTVLLTATLTLNAVSETKVFTLIVKALPYTALDALDMIAIEGTTLTDTGLVSGVQSYSTTSNVVLPTSVLGFEVEWSTTNAAALSTTGVVVRPAYGQTNSTVILTAMVLDEELTFIVTVLAIVDKPVELILSEARDILLLAGVGNGVALDITLPAVAGTEGVTVTWESSHPDVLSNMGVVNRQLDNVTVTLTATLHYADQSVTKEFSVVVLSAAEAILVESVAAALELGAGNYVKVVGVTVFGLTTEGFMFGDDSAMLFAYTQIAPAAHIVEGGVYDIYGLVDYFNGSMQFNGIKNAEQPVVAVENTEAEVTVLTPTVVTDVEAYIATLPTSYTTESPLVFEYLQLTLKVRVQSTDNYHTMFVNPDYAGGDINTAASSPFTTNALIVYYKSNKAALTPFHDLTITVNVFLYSLRNDRNLYTVIFTGTVDDIQVVALSDAETVDLVETAIKADIAADYIENTTINLPTTLLGTSIAWSSSHEANINPSTGAVVLPESGQVVVTLTAVITKGEATKTVTIMVNVGELETITVAEALALPLTSKVKMIVTVTGLIANQTYAIQDSTGAMAVFAGSASATWLTYVGKSIELIGTRAAFNGLQQVNPISVVVGDVTSLPTFSNIDGVALDNTGLLPFQSMFVTRTGLEVVSVATLTFGNIEVSLIDPVTEETIKMFWDSRISTGSADQLNALVAGDSVNLIGIPVGWTGAGARFNYTKPSQVVVVVFVPTTDQEKVDAAAEALVDQPLEVNNNLTLTLEAAGLYDTVVTWASSNTDVITNDGIVTVPVDPATVTMTATVTLGDATATRTFEILVQVAISTIAETRAMEVGLLVTIEGLVTSVAVATDGRVVAFVQDETAGIYLYKVAAADASKMVVGNIVRVSGTTAVFSDLKQISTFTKVEVISTGNTVTPMVVTDPADIPLYEGEFIQVTGYIKQTYASGSDYFLVTDLGEFRLRLVSSSDLESVARGLITSKIYGVAAGTEVTITAALGRFGATLQIMLLNESDITIGAMGSEAVLAPLALPYLSVPEASATQINNLTLPTAGFLGTTYTWSSDNTDFISNTGTVTRPAFGTSDEIVTLSYQYLIGATVIAEGTVVFTVLAETEEAVEPTIDLIFSEYIEGGSNNKAVEVYNPTNLTVDLSTYTIELFSNGLAIDQTPTQTQVLSGTLAPFSVVVFVNSSATADFKVEGHITSSITFFNGDDALVLKNSGIIIDSIGQVGTDPGTEWAANGVSTLNMTLVRKVGSMGRTDATNTFDPSVEWIAFAQDTFAHLGWHATDLFFSEYIEGGSNNKAVEVYNPTLETIDLSTYVIELFSNGLAIDQVPSQSQAMTGTLAPGAVVVFVNSSATADFKVEGHITSNITFFNGDDALVLKNAGVIVDSIGQVGTDPGTEWVGNLVSTLNMTLVRLPGTYHGRVDATSAYDPSLYWTAYAQDTFAYLGSHSN